MCVTTIYLTYPPIVPRGRRILSYSDGVRGPRSKPRIVLLMCVELESMHICNPALRAKYTLHAGAYSSTLEAEITHQGVSSSLERMISFRFVHYVLFLAWSRVDVYREGRHHESDVYFFFQTLPFDDCLKDHG